MEIRFKKVHDDAVMPSKSHASDAGFDLTAVDIRYDTEYGFIEYNTGLAMEIPEGFAGFLFPRSSLSKKSLSLCNSVGCVDANFLGEIKLRFKGIAQGGGIYAVGDRIGQLIIMPIPAVTFLEVDELGSSERGDGGFGSSGS